MINGEQLSRTLLGPIFERFAYRLWLVDQFHADKPAVMLFMSRGGLRIRYFYELFLLKRNLKGALDREDFYLSRMSVFRALVNTRPDIALARIAGEYRSYSFVEGMRYFLPKSVFVQWSEALTTAQTEEFSEQPFTAQALYDALFSLEESRECLLQHFDEQNRLMKLHFSQIAGYSTEVVLVDTGWSGSIIQGLRALFPAIEFKSAMVGRYNYGGPYPEWFCDIIGLEAEGVDYTPKNPVTSLFHHRHVIEGLCEPRWPSVEYYRMEGDVAMAASGAIPEDRRVVSEDEILAMGVRNYLEAAAGDSTCDQIHSRAEQAARELNKVVCYPSAKQARAFSVLSRSADFGTDLEVPMLLEDREGSAHQRIVQSLWLQGQAALEFGVLREPAQWLITHRGPIKRHYDRVLRLLRLRR